MSPITNDNLLNDNFMLSHYMYSNLQMSTRDGKEVVQGCAAKMLKRSPPPSSPKQTEKKKAKGS